MIVFKQAHQEKKNILNIYKQSVYIIHLFSLVYQSSKYLSARTHTHTLQGVIKTGEVEKVIPSRLTKSHPFIHERVWHESIPSYILYILVVCSVSTGMASELA